MGGSLFSFHTYGTRRYATTCSSSNGLSTDFTYTGQKVDGTGLMYYRSRYYDPVIGQFISPDTIVPDAGSVFDYNRYLYVRANPLNANDPSGHCPVPPSDMGAAICVALFIQPEAISAGPLVVHGDGRGFSNNSDPSASRGYAWIPLDGSPAQTHMNPSGYIVPTLGSDQVPMSPVPLPGGTTTFWFPASDKNTWNVTQRDDETVVVNYDLVISGPLEGSGTAPHINGTMVFQPNEDGGYDYSLSRDGFPWAEAYLHDGNGGVQTIFQDAAIRGNPHDLFGIEPNMQPMGQLARYLQSFRFGEPLTSNANSCHSASPC